MLDIKGLFQHRRLKSDHHHHWPPLRIGGGGGNANGWLYVALVCCLIGSSASAGQSHRSLSAGRPQDHHHQQQHRCKLNPYYRPVCGSNHQTFPNRDLLNCFNQNRSPNQQIRVMRHGECEDLLCPSYEQLQGRWTMDHGQPVCANNGYTYGHVNQVRCLKGFIPSLDIMHEGGCMIHEVRESLGINYQKKSCYEPRLKFEVNYVCSRANKTYENPFQALCANPRAIEKRGGKCGCPVQRSCQKMKYLTRTLKKSLRNVKEKFAVCGSDRKTYRSQHHLECARRFNSNLYKIHNGICQKNVEPCPESLRTAFSATSSVCGSDGRSYINYEALVCASVRMHPGLKFRHSGACIQRYGSGRYF